MKHAITTYEYTGDSSGYASNLVAVTFNTEMEDYDTPAFAFTILRKAANILQDIREKRSYQERVCSEYDCTGQAFGSNWRKLDISSTEGGFVVLYIHSWAIDI